MSVKRNKSLISPIVLIIGLFFISVNGTAQINRLLSNKDSLSNERLWALSGTGVVGTGTTFYLLGKQWYSGYDRVPFHFFNDNKDWLQIDKFGHGLTAYYGGLYGYNAFRWTGLDEKKSIWIGGLYGFGFLLVTEAMDGYSSGWGASSGDLVSNALGSGLFISQQLAFKKQIITPKFSYWPTIFAKYRPELLGDSHWNRWLKDYNGQTYWMSFALSDIGLSKSSIPKWLAISLGYGGSGMLGGEFNPKMNDIGVELPYFKREREYYLSLDIKFQKIKTKSPFFNAFLKGVSFVKIPFPAIGMSGSKLKFYPIHY